MVGMDMMVVVIMMMAMLVIIHAKGTLGADNQHAIGILRTEIAFG